MYSPGSSSPPCLYFRIKKLPLGDSPAEVLRCYVPFLRNPSLSAVNSTFSKMKGRCRCKVFRSIPQQSAVSICAFLSNRYNWAMSVSFVPRFASRIACSISEVVSSSSLPGNRTLALDTFYHILSSGGSVGSRFSASTNFFAVPFPPSFS